MRASTMSIRLRLAQLALGALGFTYGRGDRQEREASGYSGAEADGQTIARTVTLSPAIVATIVTAEQIFPVVGVLSTDALAFVNKPSTQAGAGVTQGRVSSAGNVALAYVNPTAAGVTPTAAEAYIIGLYRR